MNAEEFMQIVSEFDTLKNSADGSTIESLPVMVQPFASFTVYCISLILKVYNIC